MCKYLSMHVHSFVSKPRVIMHPLFKRYFKYSFQVYSSSTLKSNIFHSHFSRAIVTILLSITIFIILLYAQILLYNSYEINKNSSKLHLRKSVTWHGNRHSRIRRRYADFSHLSFCSMINFLVPSLQN